MTAPRGMSARMSVAVYGGMIAVAGLAFFVIHRLGSALSAPEAASGSAAVARSSSSADLLFHLLLALAVVMVVGRLLGVAFRAIGQPPVIGEVIGGILLGPSLLGHVSPDAYQFLLPPAVAPTLGAVANLGVILYMFLVGLEFNTDRLKGHLHTTVITSHASIVVPFVLGSVLALYLYPRFSTSDVPFTNFALFMGVAMSITAFPVLARILADRGMTQTPLGALALTCAAVDDVTAWCLLAFVVGVVNATGGFAQMLVLTAVYIVVMFVVIRPAAARFLREQEVDPSSGTVAAVFVLLLASALLTEEIGIHAIFGAFLFGVIIPHDSRLAGVLTRSLEHVVTILLLPAFFAFTGMRTEIGLVSGWYAWAIVALIIFVATTGKFGGTFVAARLSGLDRRRAAGLGILMNTRGLMELIVLNVGLELGVISPTLFTMLVLMAIVTTMATTPILQVLKVRS